MILRGADAARAQPIDLLASDLAAPADRPGLDPTGPWAADIDSVYDEARAAGFDDGFGRGRQEGYEAGLAEGREEIARTNVELMATLETLLARIDQELTAVVERVAGEATGLAMEITEALLGRELESSSDPGAEAIARCLVVAPTTGDITAHLNPTDVAMLGDLGGLDARPITIIADSTVERGDAVVRVDETLIDGRLDRALDRVAEVLR